MPDVHHCDVPPTIADGARIAQPEGGCEGSPSGHSRRRRILERIALTLLALVLGLAALAVVAYDFGSMERPSAEMRARYDALVSAGQAAPMRSSGLRIPIPGCRCHSDDPVQQVRHAGYAIRECSRCHGVSAQAQAGTPAGGS